MLLIVSFFCSALHDVCFVLTLVERSLPHPHSPPTQTSARRISIVSTESDDSGTAVDIDQVPHLFIFFYFFQNFKQKKKIQFSFFF